MSLLFILFPLSVEREKPTRKQREYGAILSMLSLTTRLKSIMYWKEDGDEKRIREKEKPCVPSLWRQMCESKMTRSSF